MGECNARAAEGSFVCAGVATINDATRGKVPIGGPLHGLCFVKHDCIPIAEQPVSLNI